MNNSNVTLPKLWRGLPIALSKITTTEDNIHFRNNEYIAHVELPSENQSIFLEEGDYVELEPTQEGFDGHVFQYHKEITQNGILHHFKPTSNFLNREEIIIEHLSELNILAKILFSFCELSEGIHFQQFEE
jgi:hypothetical protein